MSILVSIITPCLNSEKTIERTVLSVLNQNYKNIQYIVIDGRSSDKTLEILYQYQKNDARMILISKQDNSMTEALNRGLRLATGSIIASLNADDWYETYAIEHVVKLYQNKSFHCLIGNTRFVSEMSQPLYITKPWLASCLPAWYLMGCLTPECSVFYSVDCVESIGFFNENLKYTQDFEYYLRILKYYKITYTNTLLSNFAISVNQYSSRCHDKMESEVLGYIKYKILRIFIIKSSLGTFLKILFGMRLYNLNQLVNHILQFTKKNAFNID